MSCMRWLLARLSRRTRIRLSQLKELRSAVESTRRLKEVFDNRWFEDVRELILRAWREPSLKLDSHPAFIGYLHDALLDPERRNLLKEVDEALDSISEAAQRRLSDKLRKVARGTDDYVSVVFEVLVVQRFVAEELLVEYEPRIASGRPEASVTLAGQRALVEARATLDSSFSRPSGAYEPKDLGLRLAGKIQEKYQGQLSAATVPAVLFVGLNVNLRFDDDEIRVAFDKVAADAGSAVLSAIVLSEDFRARRFKVWLNPRSKQPLSPKAQGVLDRVLGL